MSGMGPGAMRALKVAVVAMGIVIILGTGVLVVVIVQRVTQAHSGAPLAAKVEAGPPVSSSGPRPSVPSGGIAPAAAIPASVVLDEPSGTRITAVTSWRGGLAVTLSGGGPDRLVLLDPAMRVVGRVLLAR